MKHNQYSKNITSNMTELADIIRLKPKTIYCDAAKWRMTYWAVTYDKRNSENENGGNKRQMLKMEVRTPMYEGLNR